MNKLLSKFIVIQLDLDYSGLKLYKEVRNSKPQYKYLNFFQIEEIIAEDFRTYALKEKTSKD